MDDLISRQAAIDALSCTNPTEPYIHYDDAVKAIKEVPSAQPERCADCVNFNKTQLLIPQPEPHWIPCSERLPEWWWENYQGEVVWNSKPVIVCGAEMNYPYSGMAIGLYGPDGWVIEDDGFAVDDTPIAWMPLPEPYRKTEQTERSDT